MAKKKNFSKVLLVEGKNDQHVVWAFCAHQNLPETFFVKDCKGIDDLIKVLPVYLKGPYDTVGVLVDADQNLESRWQSIQHASSTIFPDFPPTLPKNGLVHHNAEGKQIGVWVMPNNELTGMLEDFLALLVPDGDVLLNRVEEFLVRIEEEELNRYRDVHRIKAKIHTWLSLQENPEVTLGQSITNHYLSLDTPIAVVFEKWLRDLFNQNPTTPL
jgi:hypothetical protein